MTVFVNIHFKSSLVDLSLSRSQEEQELAPSPQPHSESEETKTEPLTVIEQPEFTAPQPTANQAMKGIFIHNANAGLHSGLTITEIIINAYECLLPCCIHVWLIYGIYLYMAYYMQMSQMSFIIITYS